MGYWSWELRNWQVGWLSPIAPITHNPLPYYCGIRDLNFNPQVIKSLFSY